MASNYIGPGNVREFIAPAGGVTTGVGVLVQGEVVVPTATVAATLPFQGHTEGVFTMAKAAGNAWAAGQTLYWDTANNNWVVAQSATARRAGKAATAALSAATTGDVKLMNIGAPVAVV